MSIARNRIINVQLRYDITGNKLTSTMHYGCDTALGADDPDLLRIQWQTVVQPKWADAVSADVRFDSVYAWADEPGTALPYVDQLTGVVGTVTGESIPENLAAVLQLKQYETNSKANGRLLIAGLSNADCVDSLVSTAAIAGTLADLATALMTTLTISGPKNFKLCALSRWVAGAKRTPPLGFEIAAVIPTRSLATQRRRTTEMTYVNA